ncbi:MAG: BTAD domain-containing putative transcriptional regulator [Micromonosporaceae bacterium]
MEYRVLGPLEISAENHLIDIASGRQRIVISTLLLAANQVVPLSRLVDAVWDDAPPVTAKSQVQICISALRQQLADAGAAGVIVTRTPGYMIDVPDDALDVKQFELLVTRGRQSAAERRAHEAVHDLRAALSLWRGPAVVGVESRIVQAAATRLNEERLNVLEECIDLELGLGRHRELIGELAELVVQYPLRERLRAQHMVALYRSGRQAEALESFRAVRQIFMEELGLDPGEELCALERAILANDTMLDLPRGVRRGPEEGRFPTAAVPRQLPAAVADFTGREDILDKLCDLLSPRTKDPDAARYVAVASLNGKGGVGKTALALHAAHALRDDYPDGQLFIHLQEADGRPVSPSESLEQFLRAFGVAPAALPSGLAELTAIYRSALAHRRVLIVLDDADSVRQVRPLIPGNPNCAVIVTSRNPLPGLEGAHNFDIGDLDEKASVTLFARVIGTDRVRAEEASARALARLCGYLPLALRIVAAKLAMRRHWRINRMVSRMEDEERRLDELVLGGMGIRTTLCLSYDNLSEDARRLFCRLSMLGAADFASWVSAPLIDADAEFAGDLLDSLVEARLVEVRVTEDRGARFRLHDLIRLYALERLTVEDPPAERTAALRRMLGCWLFLATEAHRRAYGGDFAVLHGSAEHWVLPDHIVGELLRKPLDWFRLEHTGLISAVFQAGQARLDELCWDLAMTSVTLFESDYHIADWQKTHEVALDAARRAGNVRGEAAMLYSLGCLAVTVRLADASRYLDPALLLFEKLGDAHGSAMTLGMLAFAYRIAGDYDSALAQYQKALTGFRQVGDKVGEADALTNMAQIHLDREDFDAVSDLLNEALVICRSFRAWRIVAQTEYRLGEFLLRKGDLEQAEWAFVSVLRAVVREGDVVGEAYALQGLGTARMMQGRYDLAEENLHAAVILSRRVGDSLVHGRALLAFAEFLLGRERHAAARLLIDEALEVFSELSTAAVWRARFLELKGRLDERRGRHAAAREAWRAALDLVGDADPALSRALVAVLRRGDEAGPRAAAAAD